MKLPKKFKNFYERINEFLPADKKITDGGIGYSMDILDVKLTYTKWMEDVFKILLSELSAKKMKKTREIINTESIRSRKVKPNKTQ